jgi:hypothetical protein
VKIFVDYLEVPRLMRYNTPTTQCAQFFRSRILHSCRGIRRHGSVVGCATLIKSYFDGRHASRRRGSRHQNGVVGYELRNVTHIQFIGCVICHQVCRCCFVKMNVGLAMQLMRRVQFSSILSVRRSLCDRLKSHSDQVLNWMGYMHDSLLLQT